MTHWPLPLFSANQVLAMSSDHCIDSTTLSVDTEFDHKHVEGEGNQVIVICTDPVTNVIIQYAANDE
jgi:hypothetical protein